MGTYDHVADGQEDKRGTEKWVSGNVFMGSTRFPPGGESRFFLSVHTSTHNTLGYMRICFLGHTTQYNDIYSRDNKLVSINAGERLSTLLNSIRCHRS